MLLTVVSHFVSPGDTWGNTALVNLSFVLASIALTAFILYRNRSAELALRESQNQLAHLMRVTNLGELTASISHEVNQPLAGIVTNAHACLRWLAAQPPNLEEARQAVERIVKGGNRAGAVIQRVRAMMKKSPPQMDWVDINDTILEVMALTRGAAESRRATLETELSSGLPPVPGDRIQVQQVILNLVLNALEAIDANDATPRKVVIETGREGATDVRVSVRDSGKGLGPQALEQVFDAFYTTKPDGMGMGLAISRSIIQAHDGRLWAMPNTPRGAVFRFTLPVHRETNSSVEQTPFPS
jgi:signal transduction histidine kinase